MDKIIIEVGSKKTRRWNHTQVLDVPVGGDISVKITAVCNMLRYKVNPKPLIIRKVIVNNPIRFVDAITRLKVHLELIKHAQHPADDACLAKDSLLIKSDADLLALEKGEKNLKEVFKPYQQVVETRLTRIWNGAWE